jgi:hypothetical protein
MIGGILKNGIIHDMLPGSPFYFVDIEDEGHLCLYYVNLVFIGKMRSKIYVRGGNVCLEYMKINKEE